jgi:hypothetical protein
MTLPFTRYACRRQAERKYTLSRSWSALKRLPRFRRDISYLRRKFGMDCRIDRPMLDRGPRWIIAKVIVTLPIP